ncbi:DUF58 domain-containing protein [Aquibacillus albus]|uniref:Uncharacterized protein (DUF58 family) n=1 Tax=Aquibacillus albus TaxID=1168171 RepID=A0ABS2N4Y4_9BACI|nr:DUF58 domain-containing protein [Aquibacillus albus]MBM7573215.1 uncharacterized protein (DUF58 family) [Aquibacillus albus]
MSIGWIIVVTMVFIVLQSHLYRKWGFHKIKYTRSFNQDSAFEGEEIEMVDELVNNKVLPLPWLRIESKINANLKLRDQSNQVSEMESEVFHRTLFTLMPFQKITRRHYVTCLQRGYYSLQTVSLSTGDPFGFSEKFQSVQASAAVSVYPKIVPINEIPLPSHSWLGDITVRRWIIEDPFVYAGVREYNDSDPLNHVNWKATARTGNLQVNKKDFTADHHLMIYINFDQTEDIWMPIEDESLIEKGISYAASIADYALANGVSTGFGCNGYFVAPFNNPTDNVQPSIRVEPKNGQQQLTYLLDTMAKITMDRSRNFNYFLLEDMENQVTNRDILIITSMLTEQTQQYIDKLEALGNAVEILWLEKDADQETEQTIAGDIGA